MPSYINYTRGHWQQRAAEMRLLANSVRGAGAQETMLRMAEHYDRLAAKTEEPAPVVRVVPPARTIAEPDPVWRFLAEGKRDEAEWHALFPNAMNSAAATGER